MATINERAYEFSTERVLAKGRRRRIRVTPGQVVGIIILCAVCLFWLYPLIWLFDSSFRPVTEMFNLPPKFLSFNSHWPYYASYSFANYVRAFQGFNVGLSFLMSLIVTCGGIFITIIVVSLGGYALAFIRFPLKNFWFYLCLFTTMLPGNTMVTPFYKLMVNLHMINTLWSIILPSAFNAIMLFLMRQYYVKLPYSYIESAAIDGAGHFRIWWSIIFPLSWPALAAVAIFQFRFYWNDFLYPTIMLNSDKLWTITVKIKALDSYNYGKPYDAIMSTGFLFSLIPIVIFLIFQRRFIEGLSGGVRK
jgi:ABC-type glycerol-3-phosphate transport system permease component